MAIRLCNNQSVAVVFELVVNSGLDEEAAATEELDRHPTIELRDTTLPISPPFVTRFRSENSSCTSSSPYIHAASATEARGHALPSGRAT